MKKLMILFFLLAMQPVAAMQTAPEKDETEQPAPYTEEPLQDGFFEKHGQSMCCKL